MGLAFIQFVGLNGLAKQQEIEHWFKANATVRSCEVTPRSAADEYELGIRIEATVAEKRVAYSTFKNAKTKDQMEKLAHTTYAPGATISLYINPNNLAEYRFNQKMPNPWIIGMLPGALFILMGLIALRAPVRE